MSSFPGNYVNCDGKLCMQVPVEPMGYTDGIEELSESSVEVTKNSDDDFTVSYITAYNFEGSGNSFIVHYTKTSGKYLFGKAYPNNEISSLNSGNYKVTTKGSPLTLRAMPDINSDKIGSIPNGTVVEVMSSTKEWANVTYYLPSTDGSDTIQTKTGWVSVDFLKPTSDNITNGPDYLKPKQSNANGSGKSNDQIVNEAVNAGIGIAENVIGSIF